MSLPILPLLVGRIFYRCFGKPCFVYIVWSCLGIFLVFLLSPILFWLVSLSCIISSSCHTFSAASKYILMFRFSIFACSFLICDSNLSSRPGFDFLFVVFRGIPMFSLTNFAPAHIKSFKSVMLFVGIFVNKSLTFSVSDSAVLQSWLLRESNEVSFSDMSLFMSTIIFSSWVSVCVFYVYNHFFFLGQCLRVCCVSVIIIYCLVLVRVFWFSCILCLGYGIRGLFACLPLYLLVGFQYFTVKNKAFFVIVLTWSWRAFGLKSSKFCLDFNHSFSIPSFWWVAPKITI